MAGKYELWLTNDSGVRLAGMNGESYLKRFLSLSAGMACNSVGQLSLRVPHTFDENLIRKDNMVQVWRAPTGGRLGLWQVYFIEDFEFETRGSTDIINIYGSCPNCLLCRRVSVGYSGESYVSKTDYADDMMKAIVREATQSGCDTAPPVPAAGTREWSDLSVDIDFSLGPTITKSFSFDQLLTYEGGGTLSSLANAAKENGTEVFFSVVPNVVTSNSINFIFRTYITQPGMDVSDRVVFDKDSGNLKNPKLKYIYRNECNYVYSGGKGVETTRDIQQVYDSTRYGTSKWNRCESFADARTQDSNGALESGHAKLFDGRPRIQYTGEPMDTVGTRFGRDWDFGYMVASKYRNIMFKSLIRAITLNVDENGEEILARFDYEGSL